MASTRKKTTKGKKTPPRPEPPAYNGTARLVGGVVCLLLALCVLVSYFNVDALLLTLIARVLKGLLGWGFYLTAPALLGAAVIQLRHQGRPVILRTACTLLVPLLAGVLWHLIFCRTAYELGGGLLSRLWAGGQALTCGGVVSGGLALGSEALLSKVVSIIIFVVLLLAALLGGDWAVSRPLVEKGWAPNARQIGLSGRTVRPKLIITCGISGAIQFAACMNQSEHIIAINTDPEAPIFNVAHIAMVGDLYQIVPRMIQKLKEERA